jgi:ribosomal protein L37AE/L43A
MKASFRRNSTKDHLICPACGSEELLPQSSGSARCEFCERIVDGPVLQTLRQIVALPDAIGAHACECEHPEMRRLPDAVFRCPACGAEVLPVQAAPAGSGLRSEAYRCGWIRGRFGSRESMAHDTELPRWEELGDRLDYYRGHRMGREARRQEEERASESKAKRPCL